MNHQRFWQVLATIVFASLAIGVACVESPEQQAGDVNTSRVLAEAQTGENWLVQGGRFTGEHWSPLSQIDVGNVEHLGLAWAADIPSPIGLVAEPVIVDGVVYLSAPLSVVYALDAATGERLWRFDPEVRLDASYGATISARFNRGVAVWTGAVIVGTGDCRLVAIDATRGTQLWEAQACDPRNGMAKGGGGAGITGAPVVANDKVFIGYLGSDSGARGSVGAFDTATGEELWRFWTVPGDPALGFETKELEWAAKTWPAGWAPQGGGVAWNSMTYDPVTNYLLIGTASTLPLNVKERGPGDNLFTNSVIAVDADTGAYQWHYQTTPEDGWDYDATMPKIVTEIVIAGQQRRVVFEAPKNGFFYVLDAHTGELLSADPIAEISWASHVDLETGRPVVLPEARYWERESAEQPLHIYPNGHGARNWEPMAYSPDSRLVYMSTSDVASAACNHRWRFCEGLDPIGFLEEEETPANLGRLVAWDPVNRLKRWSSDHQLPFNGGVLATAGQLVFQGTGTGELQAYHAETGESLWSRKTGSSIQAAPVSYRLGEDQYVLVAIGAGGGVRIINPRRTTSPDARGPARVLAFKLNGKGEIPISPRDESPVPKPPRRTATADQVARGTLLWTSFACETCHGAYAAALAKTAHDGAVPDLRYSPFLHNGWDDVVLGGVLASKGMPSLAPMGMTADDASAVRAYVIEQAWKAYKGSPDR